MKALIIASGGLDSTGMALVKRNQGYDVDLATFDYGQKAKPEIVRAKALSEALECEFVLFDISPLKFIFGGQNQLTNEGVKVEDRFTPSVVVPLRNSLFLQLAYIYALTHDYDEVVLGSHLDDVALDEDGAPMYPDCMADFHAAFEAAMFKGLRPLDKKVRVTSASREGMSKSELVQKAYFIAPQVLYDSWSCYLDTAKQCGSCESCRNRRIAFNRAGVPDLTEYSG